MPNRVCALHKYFLWGGERISGGAADVLHGSVHRGVMAGHFTFSRRH